MRPLRCILALTLLLAAPSALRAEDAPLEWKKLTIFIGTTPGGGYDTYARLLARHIGKHLPGHPIVTPSNRPGAGGLNLMNQMYASGAADGTEIASLAPGFVIDRVLYGDKSQARFEPTRFNWLGSMSRDLSVFVAWRAKGFTLQDVLSGKPMNVGMPGPGGNPWFYARALNSLMGAKLHIISGYPGMAEVLLAIERGELDGVAGTTWDALKATRARWFSASDAQVLLQYADARHPDLPEVPATGELIKDDATRTIMTVLTERDVISRPVFAPPGVPPERVALLRKAFDEALRDPELIAEASQMNLGLGPVAGSEVAAIVATISAPPADVVAKLRQIFQQ
jgi:tripartite-type tricarboxylate transporter receptor subunit TctC